MADQERDETDEILASIEEPTAERQMTSEEPAGNEQPEAPSWDPKAWEFDFQGKKVSPESREVALTWLAKGYNSNSQGAEFKRREADYQRQLREYERFKPYAEIDQYAQQNKDWWDHVQNAWANREQQGQPQLDPAFQAALKPLQEKLEAMSSFVTTAQEEQKIQDQKRADEALAAEIESTRKQYPTIDLNAVDETGQTLEARIIAHAQKEGLATFRAAYRDYLHDQLVESAKANSQTAQAKAAEHAKKQGLLGKSPTPKKASTDAPANSRGKSYDDVTRDVLAEYNIQ